MKVWKDRPLGPGHTASPRKIQRGLEPTSELASPRCVLRICINRDTQQKYRKGRQSQCGGCPVSILVFSFSIKGTKTGKEEKKKKENNNQLGYGF